MKRMAQKEERRKVDGWVGGWMGTPGLAQARACLLCLLSLGSAMGPSGKSHHHSLSNPPSSPPCLPCPAARRL
jgi:hypothetical protein